MVRSKDDSGKGDKLWNVSPQATKDGDKLKYWEWYYFLQTNRKGFELLHVAPPHPPALCIYHRLPDMIARDQIFQAFPLHICILQVIQDWRWEGPGKGGRYFDDQYYICWYWYW